MKLGPSDAAGLPAAELAAHDDWARAASAAISRGAPTGLAGFGWDLNHVLSYGQSLSTGQEGWPVLSAEARHPGLMMLGRSTHPRNPNPVACWEPIPQVVGCAAALEPMRASLIDYGGNLLSAAEQAALAPGNQNQGETPLEAALNFLYPWLVERTRAAALPAPRVVASVCGVSGQTIEQLSKGAQPELFNRLRDAGAAVRAAALARRDSYGVSALLFLQGEYNYNPARGGTGDKLTYCRHLRQFHRDFVADLASPAGISGQAAPPAMFLAQTGAGYTNDALGLSVGQAQFEFGLTEPGAILVGPYYPVTDKGGHLDPNGYRWIGSQFGKVMAKVLLDGEGWRPLSPLRITCRGRTVLVAFHVPEPPLVFDAPLVGTTPRRWPAKGFTVLDAAGDVPVERVEIVADRLVALTLNRPPGQGATLRYADQRHRGHGMLRDSDATVATDKYCYSPGTGQYPQAAIAERIGKPYPLWNWCIAFNLPIVSHARYLGAC